MTFKISIWILIILTAIGYIVIRFIIHKEEQQIGIATSSTEPAYFSYKKDILKKWVWEWDYNHNGANYEIINLRPVCNLDDTPLIINGRSGYICPRCNTEYGNFYYQSPFSEFEDKYAIETLIIDNVKKSNYKK